MKILVSEIDHIYLTAGARPCSNLPGGGPDDGGGERHHARQVGTYSLVGLYVVQKQSLINGKRECQHNDCVWKNLNLAVIFVDEQL